MFIAFLQPETQSATHNYQRKALGSNKSVDSMLTIAERHWRKLAATFKKS